MKPDPTGRALAAMLKEDTGASMLDSGGAYGRHHERNRARKFHREQPGTLRVRSYGTGAETRFEVEASLSVYHYLTDRVEATDAANALNRQLRNFARRKRYEDMAWMGIVDEWLESMEAEEPYCCGDWINTYNGESFLQQVLQYRCFDQDGSTFVVLQIHGGCDVRGGYTAPRIFQVQDPASLIDHYRAQIVGGVDAKGEQMVWSSENGYSFQRYDREVGYGTGPEFGEKGFTLDPAERGKGKIYVDGDGLAYCPASGELLKMYPEPV